jgi:DMSO reductase anchor subunit
MVMTDLKEKTQNALDEGRTLILGGQVLLGALLRVVFEPGYKDLPAASRYLVLWALGLITVVVALLMAPAPYHRIAKGGQDDEEFTSYAMRIMTIALLPFALSMGLSIYIFIAKTVGPVYGISAGAGVTVAALFLWYGLRLLPRGAYKKS